MPDSNEEAIKSCNSVAEIRRVEAQSGLHRTCENTTDKNN